MREIEKYIAELMSNKGIKSYRQLSLQLGMGPNEIQQIMSRGVTPSDELCRRLAEFAGDPVEIVLVIAAESRAPEGTKETWRKIADMVKKASNYMFALSIVVGGVLLASPAEAAMGAVTAKCVSSAFNNQAFWILCNKVKRTRDSLLSLLTPVPYYSLKLAH